MPSKPARKRILTTDRNMTRRRWRAFALSLIRFSSNIEVSPSPGYAAGLSLQCTHGKAGGNCHHRPQLVQEIRRILARYAGYVNTRKRIPQVSRYPELTRKELLDV